MLNVIGASLVAQTVKNLPECGRPGFDLWIGKIRWRREWLPTPVFLPGESHGQRSQGGYTLWGHKRVRHSLTPNTKCYYHKRRKEKSQSDYCFMRT